MARVITVIITMVLVAIITNLQVTIINLNLVDALIERNVIFGTSCRYEHRCSYCFRMGHPIVTCRKLQADRERGAGNGNGGNNNVFQKQAAPVIQQKPKK